MTTHEPIASAAPASTLTLHERIAAFTTHMAANAPPEVLATLGGELQKLVESGISRRAIAVGSKAPDFTLPDATGAKVTLSTLLARGPAVVTFYRGGWCPFCDLQLRAYQEILPQVRALGAELVAISPQTPDYTLSTAEQKALTFPVLSDAHNQVARSYGLVFHLSDVVQKLQTAFGNPIPKFTGDDSWELPMPGTFVLDRTGKVLLAQVDADWTKRLEPAAILEALKKAH